MANTKNLFLNYVSESLLHTQNTTGKNGEPRTFVNLSIPMAQSANGYGSISVNVGQVLASTKKDGTAVAGMKSILLGKPEATRKVSIAVKKSPRAKKVSYENIEMTNQQILDAWTESRKAYREAQKAIAVVEA